MKIAAIVQARLSSTRLPRKVLLPFGPVTLLEYQIARLRQTKKLDDLVVATSNNAIDDELYQFCYKKGIRCFRGSENDVLQRYIDVANEIEADVIVRICSDNPFIAPFFIDEAITKFKQSPCDYLSYAFQDGTPVILNSIGFFPEIATAEALDSIKSHSESKNCWEHVTQFLYINPQMYRLHFLKVPLDISSKNIRLTIDTIDDYQAICKIGQKINYSLEISAAEILDIVEKDAGLISLMKDQINKNPKDQTKVQLGISGQP